MFTCILQGVSVLAMHHHFSMSKGAEDKLANVFVTVKLQLIRKDQMYVNSHFSSLNIVACRFIYSEMV